MPEVEEQLSAHSVIGPALGIGHGGESEAGEDVPTLPILSWPYWGHLVFWGVVLFH